MKRIFALVLCFIIMLAVSSCGSSDTSGSSDLTSSSTEPTVIYEVSGKTYEVDISSINIAWDEDDEPTQYEQDTFVANVKTWFSGSQIVFTDENSFTLSGTNNGNHDFVAEDCDRVDNELYKTLAKRGSVDVLIYEDKVSFLCDFFVKGFGMYLSLDYTLTK